MLDAKAKRSKSETESLGLRQGRKFDKESLASEFSDLIDASRERLRRLTTLSKSEESNSEYTKPLFDKEMLKLFDQCLHFLEGSESKEISFDEKNELLKQGYALKDFIDGTFIDSAAEFLEKIKNCAYCDAEMVSKYDTFVDTLTEVYIEKKIVVKRKEFVHIVFRNMKI